MWTALLTHQRRKQLFHNIMAVYIDIVMDVVGPLEARSRNLSSYSCILLGLDRSNGKLLLNDSKEELETSNKIVQSIREHVEAMKTSCDSMRNLLEDVKSLSDMCDHLDKNVPEHFSAKPSQHDVEIPAPPLTKKVQNGDGGMSAVPSIKYITIEEFHAVPYYLKGRLRYEEVNDFVQAFNNTLRCKYSILNVPKVKLGYKDKKLYNEFRTQEFIAGGTGVASFCTQEDLKQFSNITNCKQVRMYLSILRHTQRLREVHTGSLVQFVVIPH